MDKIRPKISNQSGVTVFQSLQFKERNLEWQSAEILIRVYHAQ